MENFKCNLGQNSMINDSKLKGFFLKLRHSTSIPKVSPFFYIFICSPVSQRKIESRKKCHFSFFFVNLNFFLINKTSLYKIPTLKPNIIGNVQFS